MPELPEVESLRRFLDERVAGLQIVELSLHAFSALKTFDPPLEALVGGTVKSVGRKGKFLLFEVDKGGGVFYLALHLARGGWLQWTDEAKPTKTSAKPGGKSPVALRMGFSDASGATVTEAGTEKRLAVHVVRAVDEVAHIATLGPDPLQIDSDELGQLLVRASGQIKKVLTDQRIVAGVGNAYSDEALHVAKLSPFRNAAKLTDDEAKRLAVAVQQVLTEAVQRSADVAVAGLKKEKKSGLRVHGRAGEACPECGDVIREVSFATKSLQYCAGCQTGGKPLADRRMSRLLK